MSHVYTHGRVTPSKKGELERHKMTIVCTRVLSFSRHISCVHNVRTHVFRTHDRTYRILTQLRNFHTLTHHADSELYSIVRHCSPNRNGVYTILKSLAGMV